MTPAKMSTAVAAQTMRLGVYACVGLAVAAVVAFAIAGRPLAGGALAVGLLLGSANGLLAAKLIALPVPFVASSLARLLTLSMIGVAIGFALGVANIWLVILGLGVSQFALAASALRQVVSR